MHCEEHPLSPQQYSWLLRSLKVTQGKKAETGSCSSNLEVLCP